MGSASSSSQAPRTNMSAVADRWLEALAPVVLASESGSSSEEGDENPNNMTRIATLTATVPTSTGAQDWFTRLCALRRFEGEHRSPLSRNGSRVMNRIVARSSSMSFDANPRTLAPAARVINAFKTKVRTRCPTVERSSSAAPPIDLSSTLAMPTRSGDLCCPSCLTAVNSATPKSWSHRTVATAQSDVGVARKINERRSR